MIGPFFFEDEAGRAVTVNSAHNTEMHISGSRVAETWCCNPDSLVSSRQGDGSHCEDCNASPEPDVPSLRDLTKREY